MAESGSAGISLFELLAREWSLDDEIVQVEFSYDDTAVLFRSLSGKLAIASTKDAESPRSRTRIETDTGRTTIRQRKNPIPALKIAPVKVNSQLPVVRFAQQGFMAVDIEGAAQLITARGECTEKIRSDKSNITSLSGSPTGATVAIARQSCITIHQTTAMKIVAEVNLDRQIRCMAFSSAGKTLATWGDDCLELVDMDESGKRPLRINGISDVTQITWDVSGSYLACASSANAFHIVDINAGTFQKVKDYPGHVNVATFSETGKALVTSGAYRLAGWSTDDLPQNQHPGTPLTTGKAGLVIIETIAAHPNRNLVASGYANGLVTITSIGTTQEMMVHQEHASKVNCLTWSNKGEHLAIGFDSGTAAVVTFPDHLFK